MRWLTALAALFILSCGPKPPPVDARGTAGDAPPAGASYDDYLHSGRPERPADTDQADKMTLHVIDIGQGTALLFEFPCGAILVDTGGESNEAFDSTETLRRYLEDFFTRRPDLHRTLSALVVTHPHIDHTRGIDMVLATARVANVITNGQEHGDLGGAPQHGLHAWATKHRTGANHVGMAQLDSAKIGATGLTSPTIDPIGGCAASDVDPQITALWGQVTDAPDYSDNPNNHSVVLRIDFGASSIMMTGDLEFEGLDHLSRKYADNPSILDVDVYIVGHHGSKNATAPHLMRMMSPKIAVISAGPYERDYAWTARRYGHPNVKAIDELRDPHHGVSWYRDGRKVWVGVSGAWGERPSVFKQDVVNRAIYTTGWDGTIDVDVFENGWLEVKTDGRRAPDAKPSDRGDRQAPRTSP